MESKERRRAGLTDAPTSPATGHARKTLLMEGDLDFELCDELGWRGPVYPDGSRLVNIDEGITAVIQLLWAMGLTTLDSCQGNVGDATFQAYITVADVPDFIDDRPSWLHVDHKPLVEGRVATTIEWQPERTPMLVELLKKITEESGGETSREQKGVTQ